MKPSAIRIERLLEKLEAALVPPPRPCLHIITHEGDDEAAAMEKALAEHVACHPEDVGLTVDDFNWSTAGDRPTSRLGSGMPGAAARLRACGLPS
jgi:hypothetical protein